jgi:undecaprenyl-diphosphatase
MGVFQDIDRELVKTATEIGGQDQLRDQIVYVAAEILPFLAIGVGLWIFFRSGTKRQRDKDQNVALLALAAVLIAVGVRWLVGEAFERERPFETLKDLHYLSLVGPGSNSFPSLHAMILFAFAGTFYYIGHHPNWARFLLLLAVVVVTARVMAGVHYPSDIVVGAILGLAVAKVVSWQSEWLDEQMK